jgi:hypothetical protein
MTNYSYSTVIYLLNSVSLSWCIHGLGSIRTLHGIEVFVARVFMHRDCESFKVNFTSAQVIMSF